MLNRTIIFRFFVLLLCATSITVIRGAEQPRLFHRFDSEYNELSHNGVLCLLEDNRGYVWVGTMMGLNRYDGRKIKKFLSDNLPSYYILSLCEDKEGNIWIGTSEGLACYSYKESEIVSIAFNFQDSPRFVNSITCNSKGEIWFDTGGSSLYSISGLDSSVIEHKLNLPDCSKRLCFNEVDKLVVNCNGFGIYVLDNEEIYPLLSGWKDKDFFDNDEINNPIFSRKSNDVLYIASKRRGLCELNLLTKKITVLHRWASAQKPVSLYADSQEVLYVSTSSGLIIYDLRSNTATSLYSSSINPHSLSGNYLTSTLVDSRGGLWVGTREYGLNYTFPDKLFKKVHSLSSGQTLDGCMVRAMSEDYNGDIWIATERTGLLKYNCKTEELSRIYETKLPNFITTVLCDCHIVWCGTQNGIIRIDRKTGEIRTFYADNDAQQENRVLSLFRSSKSGILAGCTSGVLSFSPVKNTFTPVHDLNGIAVESFAEDQNGCVWMATYSDGVVAWDPYAPDMVKRYGTQTSTMVSSICVDKNHKIWAVGNGAELAVYDKYTDSFHRIGKGVMNGAPSASYMSAIQDSEGYLWVSTTSGLFRANLKSKSVRHFTTENGLLNNCFGRASLKTVSGIIGFGSLDGFILLKPEVNKIIENPSPHTDIISVVVDGLNSKLPTDNEIFLKGTIGSLQFNFATPGVGATSAIYARLSPIEKVFRDVSNTMSLTYENLRPGIYTLEITSHAPISIKIDPPFILSSLGVFLMVLALLFVIALVYMIASIYARRIQERKEERLMFERETALMKDKMSFLTNVVHEIKTPLTMIKTPLKNLLSSNSFNPKTQDSLQVILNGVNTLDNLSKDLLSFIRVERCAYKVEMANVNVCEIIHLLSFNFSEIIVDRNLSYCIEELPEHLYVKADTKALHTILNNLIGNAVKYSDTWIKITATSKDDKVLISVINDGPGIPEELREEIFKPFVSLDKGNESYKHSFGIGLPFSQKLAQLQNGVIEYIGGPNIEFRLTLESALETIVESTPAPKETFLEERSVVLLIEDNMQLCEYLTSKLSEEYNVLPALSAERGYSILSSKSVDLIVTDLNMPGIGGEELCRRISMDFETSHIPIIVISALADEDMKLKLIASGAVAFIEKPFTIEFLKANMAGALDKMRKMRSSTQQDVSGRFNLSRFGIRDRDEDFLKQVSEVVDRHLEDSTFTVKQMEDELAISHSSLNRKLTGLLKVSPVEFIRMRRLVAAAKILEDGKTNVSEVAYMVGFTTPSYFSKCFRKQFGVTPKEFVESKMG